MQWTLGKSAQNSKEKTSPASTNDEVSGDKQSDRGIKMDEKNEKKVVRKNMLYSDQAIAVAKAALRR